MTQSWWTFSWASWHDENKMQELPNRKWTGPLTLDFIYLTEWKNHSVFLCFFLPLFVAHCWFTWIFTDFGCFIFNLFLWEYIGVLSGQLSKPNKAFTYYLIFHLAYLTFDNDIINFFLVDSVSCFNFMIIFCSVDTEWL